MPPASLAGYSDAELLEFYNEAGPSAREWRKILEAEIDSRHPDDTTAAAVVTGTVRAYGTSPADSIRAEWERMAHAQFLQAERDCRGELVNRRGRDAGIDPWSLWSGPVHRVDIYASEELREWFRVHGRLDIATFTAQASGERRRWADAKAREEHAMTETTPERVAAATVRGYGTSPAEAARAERLASIGARAARIQVPAAPPATHAGEPTAARTTAGTTEPGTSQAVVALREGAVVTVARPHIDGAKVFKYIYTFYKRFAVWGSEAEIVTATLWTMQAHAKDADSGQPVWAYSSRLGIFGPSGSGKSWKSRLIAKLSPNGEILLEPTKASFLDLCADNHTIVITEADELFQTAGRSRGILAAVNAGYEPDRTATRKHGGKVLKIPVFTPVVLDGLDSMLAATRTDLRTMISRCIVVRAQRAPDGYRPPRFDGEARGVAAQLSMVAAAWAAQEVAAGMADTVPIVPEDLGNRPYALWEPLFVVAQHADDGDPDGPVSTACREACEYLEASSGLPDPEMMGGESELDRQMAAWDNDFAEPLR